LQIKIQIVDTRESLVALINIDFHGCVTQFNRTLLKSDGLEQPTTVALTPAMLAELPPSLRNELKEALENLDNERITAAILQIGKLDKDLSLTLTSLTEYFNYPAILVALNEAANYRTNTI
jgi:hypothetical protein